MAAAVAADTFLDAQDYLQGRAGEQVYRVAGLVEMEAAECARPPEDRSAHSETASPLRCPKTQSAAMEDVAGRLHQTCAV